MPTSAPSNTAVNALWEGLAKKAPAAQWQIVTVTFASAFADTEVPHSLFPPFAEGVDYQVLRVNTPAVIYHDGGPTRKAWQQNYILLRASQACTADILLTVADDGGARRLPEGVSTPYGVWTPVTFAAGNFTGNGGTWTVGSGDQIELKYSISGKTMTLGWDIQTTQVGAGVNYLQIALPGGAVANCNLKDLHLAQDNGGAQVAAMSRVVNGGTVLILYATAGGGAWANTGGANTTSTAGVFSFEIR